MYLKNLMRSFKIKSITKGVYIEGPLGSSLSDERYPDIIIPAVEIEFIIDNWIHRWVYISLDTGEVITEKQYSWTKNVVQQYNEDKEEWEVIEGRWFFFMPLLYLDEKVSEEELEGIKEEVRELIERRWSY